MSLRLFAAAVAATDRPLHYLQTDPDYRSLLHSKGPGAIQVSDVRYDEQSQLYYLNVTYPISQEGTGRFIGAVTALVDLTPLFAQLKGQQIGRTGHLFLVSDDGVVIQARGVTPGMKIKSEEYAAIRDDLHDHVSIRQDADEGPIGPRLDDRNGANIFSFHQLRSALDGIARLAARGFARHHFSARCHAPSSCSGRNDTGVAIARPAGSHVPLECAFQDFAGGTQRERIDELNHSRVFVGRELLTKPIEQLLLCDRRTGLANDICLHFLAETIVRHSNHRRERNARVREDHFFELGGHSLLLARVLSKIRDLLGKQIPMLALFQFPTIGALCRHLCHTEINSVSAERIRARADKQKRALMSHHHGRKIRVGTNG